MAVVAVLSVAALSQAVAEEGVRCRIRIDVEERLIDAEALAPTAEEASDAALENACALVCAPDEAQDEGDEEAPASTAVATAEQGAEADTQLEACVTACLESAVSMGLLCVDDSGELTYAEGIFDEEDAESEAGEQEEATE